MYARRGPTSTTMGVGGALVRARTWIAVALLAWPSVTLAGPDEALVAFLQATLPEDAAPKRHGALGMHQITRLDRIERAKPLKFFEPYQLLSFVYMDPAAGSPGIVLEDLRIAWTPGTERFEVVDAKWLAAYRKAHPVDVSAMSDADLTVYLGELVKLTRGADRWGFEVVKLDRRGRRVGLSFKTPREMDQPKLVFQQTVTFTESGDVETWKHLQREFRRE